MFLTSYLVFHLKLKLPESIKKLELILSPNNYINKTYWTLKNCLFRLSICKKPLLSQIVYKSWVLKSCNAFFLFNIRFQESYKRFVKTWIHFASWSQILTPKKFFLYCDWQIWLHRFTTPDLQVRSLKIRIVDSIRDLNFLRFNLFSWILTNL